MDFRAKGISNKSYQTWNDTIDKETEARLKWNMKKDRINQKFDENSDLGFREKFEVIQFEDYLNKNRFKAPEIKLIPKKQSFDKDVNEYLVKLGAKDSKTNRLKPIEMYEQNKDEKDIIYSGISRDNEGRYKYLTTRKKYKPEQKYAFPLTSSMEYGWNFYDDKEKLTTSRFKTTSFQSPNDYGLKNVIRDSFYRENGVLSDQWKYDVIKARNF